LTSCGAISSGTDDKCGRIEWPNGWPISPRSSIERLRISLHHSRDPLAVRCSVAFPMSSEAGKSTRGADAGGRHQRRGSRIAHRSATFADEIDRRSRGSASRHQRPKPKTAFSYPPFCAPTSAASAGVSVFGTGRASSPPAPDSAVLLRPGTSPFVRPTIKSFSRAICEWRHGFLLQYFSRCCYGTGLGCRPARSSTSVRLFSREHYGLRELSPGIITANLPPRIAPRGRADDRFLEDTRQVSATFVSDCVALTVSFTLH